jgi:tripartite-type tricarboxylate transporter receptor subunit TctC
VLPQIRAGTVRAIAVLSEARTRQLPNVSTSGEQGYGKYVATSWSTVVLPAKTPQSIIDKISADIAAIIKDPGFRSKMEEQGAEFVGAAPAAAQAFLIKEDNLWGPLVKASGIKPEN